MPGETPGDDTVAQHDKDASRGNDVSRHISDITGESAIDFATEVTEINRRKQMTKDQFIERLNVNLKARGLSSFTLKDLKSINDSFLDTIQDALKEGESVKWIGFGSFSPVKCAARTGRNPQTGETIEISERMKVKFKPGRKLLKELN